MLQEISSNFYYLTMLEKMQSMKQTMKEPTDKLYAMLQHEVHVAYSRFLTHFKPMGSINLQQDLSLFPQQQQQRPESTRHVNN